MVLQNVPSELAGKMVLGCGVAAVDLIAAVEKYPEADAKIRSQSLSKVGGGNAANTLTALRRLGVPCSMLCKLGQDPNGDFVRSDLEGEGVDTSACVTKPGLDSPFTYIIVDTSSHTRTCIHTPIQEELLPDEVTMQILSGVNLVHLDSRNTLAAIKLAQLAIEAHIPVSLDIEKNRPHVETLLPMADYIMTNSKYPSIFLPDRSLLEGMAALLEHGRAKFVVTTLGEHGSVLICRAGAGSSPSPRSTSHQHQMISTEEHKSEDGKRYDVIRCKACAVENIIDTTGAGDAYIGAMICGLITEMGFAESMILASHIAARKCMAAGARAGLPRRDELDQTLL